MSALMETYTACILAGGLGTRLRKCVSDRPKVLALVAGKPFLSYIIQQFANSCIKNCILCTGYLSSMIEDEYGTEYAGVNLIYSHEEKSLGTGGALKNAEKYIQTENVIVANGDSYFGADLSKAAAVFESSQSSSLLMLNQVDNAARYGRVQLNTADHITNFNEKDGLATPGIINAGIYFLKRKVISNIPAECNISLEKDVFPDLIIAKKLSGYLGGGTFVDIGTPESYREAQKLLADT